MEMPPRKKRWPMKFSASSSMARSLSAWPSFIPKTALAKKAVTGAGSTARRWPRRSKKPRSALSREKSATLSTSAGTITLLKSTTNTAAKPNRWLTRARKSKQITDSDEYAEIGRQPDCKPGEPSIETARAAAAALEEAVTLARRGELHAVVTGPIHKARMYEAGFKFPGQTEFFAERCAVKNFAKIGRASCREKCRSRGEEDDEKEKTKHIQ